MNENKMREQIWREIEEEAAALERKVQANEELDFLEMPENSFDDLMARIAAEKAKTSGTAHEASGKSNVKPFRIRKRALMTAALVAILLAGTSLGVTGAKLFVPRVENRGKNGELNVIIDNEELLYYERTEDEVYEEIEEQLGILALRLMDKPNGMELQKVYIDKDSGEALMEFYYGEHIMTVYQNKRHDSASFGTQPDGTVVDSVELFYLDKSAEIKEIDKGNGEVFYRTELEYGNAYYCIRSDIDLEAFKNILNGIIFDTI